MTNANDAVTNVNNDVNDTVNNNVNELTQANIEKLNVLFDQSMTMNDLNDYGVTIAQEIADSIANDKVNHFDNPLPTSIANAYSHALIKHVKDIIEVCHMFEGFAFGGVVRNIVTNDFTDFNDVDLYVPRSSQIKFINLLSKLFTVTTVSSNDKNTLIKTSNNPVTIDRYPITFERTKYVMSRDGFHINVDVTPVSDVLVDFDINLLRLTKYGIMMLNNDNGYGYRIAQNILEQPSPIIYLLDRIKNKQFAVLPGTPSSQQFRVQKFIDKGYTFDEESRKNFAEG